MVVDKKSFRAFLMVIGLCPFITKDRIIYVMFNILQLDSLSFKISFRLCCEDSLKVAFFFQSFTRYSLAIFTANAKASLFSCLIYSDSLPSLMIAILRRWSLTLTGSIYTKIYS